MLKKNNYQNIQIDISEEFVGLRIDKALSNIPEIGTRSRAQYLIDNELVKIFGKTMKASYELKNGDVIDVQIPIKQDSGITEFHLDLDIMFEDADIIVINKPSGLVTHPAAGHQEDTLVNALVAHTKDLSMKFGEDRPGIVHRLDKETSGILVVAKNDFAHENLALQFKNRSTHRIYHAICLGEVLNPSGKIESVIARHPTNRKKFASVKTKFSNRDARSATYSAGVRALNSTALIDAKIVAESSSNGKHAITNYKILEKNNSMSLVELKLETGRTHQIRVHLSELGIPICGDELYGGSSKLKSLVANKKITPTIAAEVNKLGRFLLHARELGFVHPKTQEKMFFSIDWPKEDLNLINSWGFYSKDK